MYPHTPLYATYVNKILLLCGQRHLSTYQNKTSGKRTFSYTVYFLYVSFGISLEVRRNFLLSKSMLLILEMRNFSLIFLHLSVSYGFRNPHDRSIFRKPRKEAGNADIFFWHTHRRQRFSSEKMVVTIWKCPFLRFVFHDTMKSSGRLF